MSAFFWRFAPEARDPRRPGARPHQNDAVALPMEQDSTFFSFMQVNSAGGLRVSNMLKQHGIHDKVR